MSSMTLSPVKFKELYFRHREVHAPDFHLANFYGLEISGKVNENQ